MSAAAEEASSFLGTSALQSQCSLDHCICCHHLRRVLELLEKLGGDGEVVASGKLGDLTGVSEGSTHDDGLVTVLLVVVEDLLDRLDSRVGGSGVLLTGALLVPVEDLRSA